MEEPRAWHWMVPTHSPGRTELICLERTLTCVRLRVEVMCCASLYPPNTQCALST